MNIQEVPVVAAGAPLAAAARGGGRGGQGCRGGRGGRGERGGRGARSGRGGRGGRGGGVRRRVSGTDRERLIHEYETGGDYWQLTM